MDNLFGDDEGLEFAGLIQGPEQAEALCSPTNDPATAIEAATDEAVQLYVRRGTARLLLMLLEYPDGLTDDEAIDSYRSRYEEEWRSRGTIGFVRSVLRNWCLLKPNDDTRNHLHKNLELIHRTGQVRVNRYSARKNVVFNFIQPPTTLQIRDWERIAAGEDAEAA